MGEFFAWVRGQLDRALAVSAATLGALFVFLGWFGVSGASLTTEQIPYLASGAVGGLFLLGVAATLWLSADMRDEWRKLDDIYELMQAKEEAAPTHSANGTSAAANDEHASTGNGRRPLRVGQRSSSR